MAIPDDVPNGRLRAVGHCLEWAGHTKDSSTAVPDHQPSQERHRVVRKGCLHYPNYL